MHKVGLAPSCMHISWIHVIKVKFEDIKEVIRSRKSKVKQCNSQMSKGQK